MNNHPNSSIAETMVLTASLIDNDSFYAAVQSLKPEHFYQDMHQQIFKVMVETESNNLSVISDKLSATVPSVTEYLIGLTAEYNASNVSESIAIILDKFTRRKIIQAAALAISSASTDADQTAQDITNTLHQRLYDAMEHRELNKPQLMRDLLVSVFDHMEILSPGINHGVKSGIVDLDTKLCGFGPAELIIIAGRPAMGKSTLADTIIRHNGVSNGKSVAVFSLEMSKLLCASRMLFAEAEESYHAARQGIVSKVSCPRLSVASDQFKSAKIWIDDSPELTTTDIITKCNYIKAQTGIDLIVVDYLQLMDHSTKSGSRQEEISKISRGLKKAAKVFNCPVIALSQLSREVEKRSPPKPMLADLRESGAIEQDADVVLLLYRDEVYDLETKDKGVAEIIIGKQRNGPVGVVRSMFDGTTMRFLNLEENRRVPECKKEGRFDNW